MTSVAGQRPILLTSWDDGSVTDRRLAELLARYEFRGTFFATARPPATPPASEADLRSIVALGHEIGNHGTWHRSFTTLSDSEILEDTRNGLRRVQEFSESVAALVAPPNGRVNQRVLRVLTSAGYRVRTAPIICRRTPHEATLEPTCQLFPHRRMRTFLHVTKRHVVCEPFVAFHWFRSSSIFDRLERLVDGFAQRRTPLHIWGHSEEIERLRYWEAVERLFAFARARGYMGMTLSAYVHALPSSHPRSS